MRTNGTVAWLLAAVMNLFIFTTATHGLGSKPTNTRCLIDGCALDGVWVDEQSDSYDHSLKRRGFTETVTVTVATCTEEPGKPSAPIPPSTISSTTTSKTTTTGTTTATTTVPATFSSIATTPPVVPPVTSEIPPTAVSTETPPPPATPVESSTSTETETAASTTELSTTFSVPTATSSTTATIASITPRPNAGAQVQCDSAIAIVGMGFAMFVANF